MDINIRDVINGFLLSHKKDLWDSVGNEQRMKLFNYLCRIVSTHKPRLVISIMAKSTSPPFGIDMLTWRGMLLDELRSGVAQKKPSVWKIPWYEAIKTPKIDKDELNLDVLDFAFKGNIALSHEFIRDYDKARSGAFYDKAKTEYEAVNKAVKKRGKKKRK